MGTPVPESFAYFVECTESLRQAPVMRGKTMLYHVNDCGEEVIRAVGLLPWWVKVAMVPVNDLSPLTPVSP